MREPTVSCCALNISQKPETCTIAEEQIVLPCVPRTRAPFGRHLPLSVRGASSQVEFVELLCRALRKGHKECQLVSFPFKENSAICEAVDSCAILYEHYTYDEFKIKYSS